MKIVKIKVENLGAIKEKELQLDGASVLVTGANNSGKTTLLKSIWERLKGQKNLNILRINESNGRQEVELTDGSRIVWKVTEKTDAFEYITKEGVKQTSSVITFLQDKLFASSKAFNIDNFLAASPKKQSEMLCFNSFPVRLKV